MKTLFLPGFSLKNKEWMDETIASLPDIEFLPIYWDHWQPGKENVTDFAWNLEIAKIKNKVNQPINILAKSIGSVLAAKLINQSMKVNKVILCGLPLNSIPETKLEIGECLKKLDPVKVLIIQNELDPLGSFVEIEQLVNSINQSIMVLSQKGADHHYPYPNLFKDFLS